MKRRESFWEHVNAALDERRDPLEDAAVQACLAEEPELAHELARLRARIEGLRMPRTSRRRRVAAIVAAVVVATVGTYEAIVRTAPQPAVTSAPQAPGSMGTSGELVADRDASAVIAFRSEVIVESAESRTITRFDGQRSWRTQETRLPTPREGSPSTPGLVARIDRISYPR